MKNTASTWVMIANASDAYVYSLDNDLLKKGKLQMELLLTHQHPQSRMKESELISDRSGHYYSGQLGHGSYNNATDPKQHEAELFAKSLAEKLEASRLAADFHGLILVSPPHFYGLLNKHLNKNLQPMIIQQIQKDYTKLGIKDLINHLAGYLLDN